MFIDVHAHLYHEDYEDIEKIIKNAEEWGVKKIICSGSSIENSKQAVEIASRFENVFATIGVHPDDVGNFDDESERVLRELAKSEKVKGIGEIGLDYYTSGVPKEKQKEVFLRQIKIAYDLKLPIVIHTRDATGDTIDLLKENKELLKYGGVIHCFNKNSTVAKMFLDLGMHLSIGGALTFAHTEKMRESVRVAPSDRLLLETDCPFMTPVPFRGQVNEPKNVVIVAEEIAKIRETSVEEIGKITTFNAEKLFKI